MPKSTRFSRLPKVEHLRERGVSVEAMPTLQVLADHADNRTGICWPSMERLAGILGRSTRTVSRHLHQLQALGLVEFVERRRWRGRYSSYTFRVVFITELIRRKKAGRTSGHEGPVVKGAPYKERTKRGRTTPQTPQQSKEEQRRRRREGGYGWLFGEVEADGAG